MRAVIIDTETTGTAATDEVIELAWLEVSLENGCLFSENSGQARFKPSVPISFGAMAAHHILPEELDGRPRFHTSCVPQADIYIGHKIEFDLKMCGLAGAPSICTLAIARKLWPGASHTLSALMYSTAADRGYKLSEVRQALKSAHSADADVLFCFDLLKLVCLQQYIPDLDALYAFGQSCMIPHIMPFGKFKDQPVSAVDPGYRAWYRKQSETDPWILRAFETHPFVKEPA